MIGKTKSRKKTQPARLEVTKTTADLQGKNSVAHENESMH
jgi:hypothetical protein